MQNSFLMRTLRLFLAIYVALLFRDIFFMGYVYVKYREIFWDNIAFYEAFKATFPLYFPLAILDLIYTKAKNQKKHMQPEKQKKWKKKKK
ncbi:hypothetical protein [Actinobacillus porcinus]|uniref:hypothetical protein n=1 Tax=Actinobacillus porcinus TaxID=51048 RepID=UPI002A91EA31|nr:hypothetical protein [Actinobacillus porcinus]MDY6214892.1 hypothetical protein [Actinobacillus porcinus]